MKKGNPEKVRGRRTKFVGAWVRPELRRELEAWAAEEDRTLSKLVTRLISADRAIVADLAERSMSEASAGKENAPERKRWPEISLEPPVRMTML